jgi:hypothetical protein
MAENRKPQGPFYLLRIILTVACVPIAYAIDVVLLKGITRLIGDYIVVQGVRRITEDYLALYFFVPTAGILTGVVQFGLLRLYLSRMGWWILATGAGWLLGALIVWISGWLQIWTLETFQLAWVLSVMGLCIGTGQWLLLRKIFPSAGWWISASIIGWGLVRLITGNTLDQFGLFVLGLLPACATAVAFAQLWRGIKTAPGPARAV